MDLRNLKDWEYYDFLSSDLRATIERMFPAKDTFSIKTPLDYVERKRQEAEGLERNFRKQGISTEKVSQPPWYVKGLQSLFGVFTLPLRGVYGQLTKSYDSASKSKLSTDALKRYIKNTNAEKLDKKYTEGNWFQDFWRFNKDIALNQGQFSNKSADDVLRRLTPKSWTWTTRPINWLNSNPNDWILEAATGKGLTERIYGKTPGELMSEQMNIPLNKEGKLTSEDVVKEGREIYKKIYRGERDLEKLGMKNPNKLYQWGFNKMPNWMFKPGQFAAEMVYETTKDPAAILGLLAEEAVDPSTWFGASGATKIITMGDDVVKVGVTKGLLKNVLEESVEGTSKKLIKDISQEGLETLLEQGIRLSSKTPVDDAVLKSVKEMVRSGDEIAIKTLINNIDDIPVEKLLNNNPLMDITNQYSKRYGINFTKGNVGVTDEGLRRIGQMKADLQRSGFLQSDDVVKAFKQYADEHYQRAGATLFDVNDVGNVKANKMAMDDILPRFQSKALADEVAPSFIENVVRSGDADKFISRGGIEFLPWLPGKRKTVIPYSLWEDTKIPLLGSKLAKATPSSVRKIFNKITILMRPARLAPQELHDIFMTEMQIMPPYKIKKWWEEIEKVRKEHGLNPTVLDDAAETQYTFNVAYIKSIGETIKNFENNPTAINKINRILKDMNAEIAPYLKYIKDLSDVMGENTVKEYKNMVGQLVDILSINTHRFERLKSLRELYDKVIVLSKNPLATKEAIEAAYSDIKTLSVLLAAEDKHIATNLYQKINYALNEASKPGSEFYESAIKNGYNTINSEIKKYARIQNKYRDYLKDTFGINIESVIKYSNPNKKYIVDENSYELIFRIVDKDSAGVRNYNNIQRILDDVDFNQIDLEELKKMQIYNLGDTQKQRYTQYVFEDLDQPDVRIVGDKKVLDDVYNIEKEFENLGPGFSRGKHPTSNLGVGLSDYNPDYEGLFTTHRGAYKYTTIEKASPKDLLREGTEILNNNLLRTKKTPVTNSIYLNPDLDMNVLKHEMGHYIQEKFYNSINVNWVIDPAEKINAEARSLYEELVNNALLYKAKMIDKNDFDIYTKNLFKQYAIEDDKLKNIFDNTIHKGTANTGDKDALYKEIVNDAYEYVDNQIYEINTRDTLKLQEKISKAEAEIKRIKEIADKRMKYVYDAMAGKGKAGERSIYYTQYKTIDDMPNSLYAEVFQYRKGMTKSERARVSKLRKYLRTYVNLPENEKEYSAKLAELLKDILDYERIKGIPTNEYQGLWGRYVPSREKQVPKGRTRIKSSTNTEQVVADIAKKPSFLEAKSWDNPIDHILKHPQDATGIETGLTKLIGARKEESIKAAATIDYLRYAKKFGIEESKLKAAERTYLEYRKGFIDNGMTDVAKADRLALNQTIDDFGFDFRKFTEKMTGGKGGEDIYNVLQDTLFTPEVMDYIRATHQFFADKNLNALLQILRTMNKWWKTFATVVTPGFHSRNAQSNLYNMFLANGPSAFDPKLHNFVTNAMNGIDDEIYHPILKRTVKTTELIEEAEKRGTLDLGLLGQEIYKAERRLVDETKTRWGRIITNHNPLSVEGPLARFGYSLGQIVENEARLALFMDTWRKFGDLDFAAERVNQFLFNYRDITNFDEYGMKTLIPFWTWSKKNVPLQFRNLVRQPRKFGTFVHLKNYMRNISEDQKTGEIKDYKYEPEYISSLMGVVTPFKTTGGSRMVYNPNFSFQDIGKLDYKDWLAGLTPFLKVPGELIFDKELYTGAPINTNLKEAPAYIDWLTDLGLKIPGVYKGVGYEGESITQINPILEYLTRQIPIAGNIARVLPQSQRLKEKAPLKTLSLLAGVKFFEYNPKTAEYWYLKDRIAELEKLKDFYRKRGLWREEY